MKNENSQKLLIRPFIQCNESLSGFLYRVSKINDYRFSYLNNSLHLSIYEAHNNEFNQEALQKLAALVLRGNDSLSEKNGYNLQSFFGSELYSKIIMKNKVKYCPICIKEKYYHRTVWCFTPFHLCIEHNVMMIDQCTQCGHLINLATFTDQRCEICSFYYQSGESVINENFILMESQRQLITNIWDKESYVIPNCNFDQFFRLAFRSFHLLIGAADYTAMTTEKLTFFYNRSMGEKSGFKLANALANVYWMYLEFPKHFLIVLEDFLRRNKGQQRYERLSSFETIFDDQDFTWVQEAYNAYFIDQIDEGNVRKDFSVFKRNPGLLADRRKIRREEVRQITGIAYEKLHELNDFNELQIETKYTNCQQRYLVEKSTIAGFLIKKQTLISKKEVGLIIGIIPDSVQKIVDAGYLTPIKVANSPKVVFQFQEVNKLVEDCLGVIVEEINPSLVRFHNVLSKYAKYTFTILEIIAFTLSGQLKPFRVSGNRTLADNYYDEGQLKACLEILKKRRQDEKGLFFNDVMKILKIGEKRLWKILKEQDIEADFTLIMKDGRKRYYFNEETISRIRGYVDSLKGLI